MDLQFDDGRAVVPLANGTMLSIINGDRNRVIHNDPVLDLYGALGAPVDVRATEGTFEVAILRGDGCVTEPDTRLTTDYMKDGPNWTLYRSVTMGQIDAYVALIGLEEK